jgi:hypothetical protein
LATKERKEHIGKGGEVFDGINGITELRQEEHEKHEGKTIRIGLMGLWEGQGKVSHRGLKRWGRRGMYSTFCA